jgi:hypothetical protein
MTAGLVGKKLQRFFNAAYETKGRPWSLKAGIP